MISSSSSSPLLSSVFDSSSTIMNDNNNNIHSPIMVTRPPTGELKDDVLDNQQQHQHQQQQRRISNSIRRPREEVLDYLSSLEGCKIPLATTTTTSRRSEEKPVNKPFWIPSYPNSDPNGIISRLVSGLTGIERGSKSYYASARGGSLRRCFGSGLITVSCECIHPVVPMENPSPQQQSKKFQRQLMIMLRNPYSVIPAHHQNKAKQYHNVIGQVKIEDWRNYRDSWMEQTFINSWEKVLVTWKEMSNYYEVGMYIAYEHLLDMNKGPIITKRMSDMFSDAGYPTINNGDNNNSISTEEEMEKDKEATTCVWHKAVKDLIKNGYNNNDDSSIIKNSNDNNLQHHEFAIDYIPRYTKLQHNFMISRLQLLQQKYKNDDDLELYRILEEYIAEIQSSPIDNNDDDNKQAQQQ